MKSPENFKDTQTNSKPVESYAGLKRPSKMGTDGRIAFSKTTTLIGALSGAKPADIRRRASKTVGELTLRVGAIHSADGIT
jgi:hypothetical protein